MFEAELDTSAEWFGEQFFSLDEGGICFLGFRLEETHLYFWQAIAQAKKNISLLESRRRWETRCLEGSSKMYDVEWMLESKPEKERKL